MASLPTDLRNKLERVIIEARDAADKGARAALESLAVHHHEPYPHIQPVQRELRNHLRARARQLGDRKLPRADAGGRDHEINHLTDECAYEHWHRMLFARILAENNLLIEPEENIAISLSEAEELAAEAGMDVWVYASRCAQRMLPQIFRPDDPLLQVSFAAEHMLKLEKLLATLPSAVFTASDALGWVYQFWQSKKKDEVNRSEVKIGADEIAAVTQLFTEPYMVEFLIHNTLGAWWAGKKIDANDATNAKTEDELRAKLTLPGVTWDYLRFVHGENGQEGAWRPAAGTFDGWPMVAKSIKGLDPCCGSGHFLVALFRHLVPIRMAEEGLPAREAVDAVLSDNIHGLEIDERCCQIAAFAMALAAWSYPNAGGYRSLPELHIACTGIAPQATEEQWVKLAEKSGMPTQPDEQERIKNGLLNLHRLFSQAPTLGSLIDPKQLKDDVFAADYETIQPYLAAVLKAESTDDETLEQAIAAAGMVKAADLLAGEFTLIITNVPYLGLRKQGLQVREFCETYFADAKADLGTVMVVRSLRLLQMHGTSGVVLPRNFLFKDYFEGLRIRMLREKVWGFSAELGPTAFEGITGEVVDVALLCLSEKEPNSRTSCVLLDVSDRPGAVAKANSLRVCELYVRCQEDLRKNPNARVGAGVTTAEYLLENDAIIPQGIKSGDDFRWLRQFWEVLPSVGGWDLCQTAVGETCHYGGLHMVVDWRTGGKGMVRPRIDCKALGKPGVGVTQTGSHRATLYLGTRFDSNIAPIVPFDPADLLAIWAYVSSADYPDALKRLSPGLFTTNSAFLKVEFDRMTWKTVALEKYPDGIPEPESDDPTQWLFHGHPCEAEEDVMLQVAVARLLGYRWPAELDDKMRLSKRARALIKQCGELAKLVDIDGIVCIPAVRGEEPAAERLLRLLGACKIEPGVDLDDWLRNSFFEEHCRLFHDRPFLWHVWDGRKRDGFHALVNYHKLCEGGGKGRRLLESLTYAYLGEWITRQKDDVKRGEGGAEDRLAAALELQKRLEAILAGEPPFDIFVRWKPLTEQPIGWDPDINDGVRTNIRPFMASDIPGGRAGAGILRYKPNIKWTKDRGKEPLRPKEEYPWFWGWNEKTEDFMGGKSFDGNRWNDCHYTNKARQTARQETKK